MKTLRKINLTRAGNAGLRYVDMDNWLHADAIRISGLCTAFASYPQLQIESNQHCFKKNRRSYEDFEVNI